MVIPVTKPAGLNDKLPAIAYDTIEAMACLQDCMEIFGYSLVDTPVVEYSELFLRKSGEELVGRLYAFEHRDRSVCLRPEFTASIGRLFVEHLQHMPKPIRMQFAGPVFRYESPRRSRSRQFTIVGVELIGTGGRMADAEVIALACEGLKWVGLSGYQLIIGHVGVVDRYLKQLGLDGRARRFVIRHMEDLRKREKGRAYVHDQLEKQYTGPLQGIKDPKHNFEEFYFGIRESHDQPTDTKQEISSVLSMMLRSAEATLKTSRSEEEIAERLLLKLRRANEVPLIEHALDFVEQLGQINGTPNTVLQETENLLHTYNLDVHPLRHIRDILDLLGCYGIPEKDIVVDMGLGRGVHYYTGMVFEIHALPSRPNGQLCGGGRYDDLLRLLGSSQDTPAAGFAYGLERIVDILQPAKGEAATWEQRANVLVAPISQEEAGYAVEVAQHLRRQLHLIVELDIKATRSLGNTLKYADGQGIPYVIIVGAEEKSQRTVTIRKMLEREQIEIPLHVVARSDVLVGGGHVEKRRLQ